jgi:hypothetical protein
MPKTRMIRTIFWWICSRLMQFVNIRFASTFPASWPIASAKTWRARRATSSRGNGQKKNAILYQVWPLTSLIGRFCFTPILNILVYFLTATYLKFYKCNFTWGYSYVAKSVLFSSRLKKKHSSTDTRILNYLIWQKKWQLIFSQFVPGDSISQKVCDYKPRPVEREVCQVNNFNFNQSKFIADFNSYSFAFIALLQVLYSCK